jgi:hypothetical protein
MILPLLYLYPLDCNLLVSWNLIPTAGNTLQLKCCRLFCILCAAVSDANATGALLCLDLRHTSSCHFVHGVLLAMGG